ncbi:hypothetical protein G3A_09710 [Bacillus sp. 17376]|nr:hypothetical protein G3A_09710 [Bacillus sp. 17376]
MYYCSFSLVLSLPLLHKIKAEVPAPSRIIKVKPKFILKVIYAGNVLSMFIIMVIEPAYQACGSQPAQS